MFQIMVASAERVFEFLDEKEEEGIEHSLKLEKVRGEVTFEHVRFGYTEDKIIIKNFTSRVSVGQTVAIVGPTGAGKTTMGKLRISKRSYKKKYR